MWTSQKAYLVLFSEKRLEKHAVNRYLHFICTIAQLPWFNIRGLVKFQYLQPNCTSFKFLTFVKIILNSHNDYTCTCIFPCDQSSCIISQNTLFIFRRDTVILNLFDYYTQWGCCTNMGSNICCFCIKFGLFTLLWLYLLSDVDIGFDSGFAFFSWLTTTKTITQPK